MFKNIDALKKKLDQHRPLSPAIVKNLQEDLIVRRQSTIEMQFIMLKTLFEKKSLFLNGRFEISISSF